MISKLVPSMQGRSIVDRVVAVEIDRIELSGIAATPSQAEKIRQEIKRQIEEKLKKDSDWRPRAVSERISLMLERTDLGEDELAQTVARQILLALNE